MQRLRGAGVRQVTSPHPGSDLAKASAVVSALLLTTRPAAVDKVVDKRVDRPANRKDSAADRTIEHPTQFGIVRARPSGLGETDLRVFS